MNVLRQGWRCLHSKLERPDQALFRQALWQSSILKVELLPGFVWELSSATSFETWVVLTSARESSDGRHGTVVTEK